MNNINKRKHGISKLEFISYVYGHNYVQSSFPAISKHIDKSSLKDTLQLKILRAILKNTTLYFRENYINGIRELDVSWSYALLIPIEFSFHFGFLWYSITIPRIFGADSRFHMKQYNAETVFCQYWQNFHLGSGNGYQAIILFCLDTFLIFPNFLSLKSFGKS